MGINFHNNTTTKTLDNQFLLHTVKHFFVSIDVSKIVSVELTDTKVTVMGEDCLLLEHNINKPLKVSGKIRWFDESSGAGMIRLDSGKSVWFYSCNVVGANQQYPELVTNVQFEEGDSVTCVVSADSYTFEALGLISVSKKIKKAKGL